MAPVTLCKEGMRGGAGMQRMLGADDIIPEIFPCLAGGLSPGELQSQDKFIPLSCDRRFIVFCPFWTAKAVSGDGYGAFRKLLMGVCLWF